MKSFLSRAALSAAVVFSAFVAPCLSFGQDSSVEKPAVEVAVKSIDGILEDVEFGMEQAGFGDQAAALQMGVGMLQNAIDTEKPIGVKVWFEENEPKLLAMLPVSDYEAFLDLISQGGLDIEEEDDYAIIETPVGQTIRMRSANGYVFVSESEDALKNLPKNVAKVLKGVRGDRFFSAKVHVQRIPKELRDKAVELMKEGFENAMDNSPAPENIAEMQRRMNEVSMKNLIELVQKSDLIDAGFTMDQKNEKLVWDLEATGVEGSKMARQANKMAGKTGKLSNFLLDDVAAHLYGFGVILDEDKENMKDMLTALQEGLLSEMEDNGSMPEEAVTFLSGVLEDSVELLQESANSGRVDMGAVVDTSDKLNALIGASIGNGEKFDALVKKVVSKVEEKAGGQVSVSSKTVSGIKFTVVEGPTGGKEEVVAMFGDKIQIMAGRKGNIGYIAAGASPEAVIKKVMNNKGNAGDHMIHYNFRVGKILNFVSDSAPNSPEVIEDLLDGIDQGSDRVVVTGKAIKNGSKMSVKVDAALLKLIGIAIKSSQGGPNF